MSDPQFRIAAGRPDGWLDYLARQPPTSGNGELCHMCGRHDVAVPAAQLPDGMTRDLCADCAAKQP